MKKIYIILFLAILITAGCSFMEEQEDFQFHSHVRVSTTSGNVKLFLNEEQPDVNLQLSSGSGRHSVGILLEEDQRQSKGRTEGKSGSGQYDLQIKTNSGNISVQ